MSFLKRLISAFILGPIVLFVLWLGGIAMYAMLAMLVVVSIYEFHNISKNEVKKRWRFSVLFVGAIYATLASIALGHLREDFGFVLSGMILIGVWASDIGAYIFGKLIGGKKLCPSISPNKTVAGLVGACVFPYFVLDGYLAVFAVNMSVWEISYWSLGASLVIGLLGQTGDLMISMLKRRVGLKDTGNLIPGHGGILDRIDSMMLVVIAIWLLLNLKVVLWNIELLVF
jgi:phosphatidate cytidylyltransferase